MPGGNQMKASSLENWKVFKPVNKLWNVALSQENFHKKTKKTIGTYRS